MKRYPDPEQDFEEPELQEELEEKRHLAKRKREWYHDFWRLMEEHEADYKYKEE